MIQLPLIQPDSKWSPVDQFPEFRGADAVGIDTETRDPYLDEKGAGWATNDGYIVGISLSLLKGRMKESFYLPIAHQNGANLDKGRVVEYIKDVCKTDIPKLFHNSIYDIGWLGTEGIKVQGSIFDTQIGAALLDERRYSYSLDNIGKDFIGVQKDEELLKEAAGAWGIKKAKDIKKNLWRLPPQFVGPYAEQDADMLHALKAYELKELEQDKLLELSELEHSLIPLLIAMRLKGIRVDLDRAEQTRASLVKQKQEMLDEINRKYGFEVDVWSADSVAQVFDSQNLTYPKTLKTKAPSFTKEFLEGHAHEFPNMVRTIRQLENTIGTMIDGQILKFGQSGRIHHELHPLKSDKGGTVSGRFSCSNPNLQQSSGRDEVFAPLVRGIFLPEDGEVWGAFDYANQEPRLTLHYSQLTKQAGASKAVEEWNKDPSISYHAIVAEMCDIEKPHAKTINLGLAYGMGELKLCQSLGLPTEIVTNERTGRSFEVAGPEGKGLLEEYHRKVPFIQGIMDKCTNLAAQRGWIRTIGGRLCRYNRWESSKWEAKGIAANRAEALTRWGPPVRRAFTHKALNSLIQGSAADMTKKAMRVMWEEGIVPMHQMHDELDVSIGEERLWRRVEEIMVHAVELVVPVVVDVEFGRTWGEASFKKLTWEQVNA